MAESNIGLKNERCLPWCIMSPAKPDSNRGIAFFVHKDRLCNDPACHFIDPLLFIASNFNEDRGHINFAWPVMRTFKCYLVFFVLRKQFKRAKKRSHSLGLSSFKM